MPKVPAFYTIEFFLTAKADKKGILCFKGYPRIGATIYFTIRVCPFISSGTARPITTKWWGQCRTGGPSAVPFRRRRG